MGAMGKLAVKAIDSSSSALTKVAMWGTFAMMALISWDVTARYLFASPLLFSDELSGYLLVYICFLGAAGTLKQKRHINVDVMVKRLKARTRMRLELVTSFLSLGFLIISLWHSYVMVYHSYVRGVRMPSVLFTPIWIPQSLVLVGTFSLVLQYIVEIRKAIKAMRNGEGGKSD